MAAWLIDPLTIALILFVVVVALGFGMARREPWWAIGASMVGVALFTVAVRWGGDIGEGADIAVSVAAIGASLWTLAVERVQTRRRTAAA
jgi:4-hydroxybenzoate polyprenyltransferase